MAIHLALKTLNAIDGAIAADQGASYRQYLQQVLPHIGDAYRGAEKSPFRRHMGASGIGKDCARAIWYSFRWYSLPNFDGRMLRLFNRGHLEEGRFIASLLTIGVQVYQQDEHGKQFRISAAGGHFGGSGDGVGLNIPDLPAGMPSLLEFKTHNDKSFAKLQKSGVYAAKYEHYVQQQVYMRKMKLDVALYGAVNKNDDTLHLELVPIDTIIADQFIDRGVQLVFMRDAPKRISESPGWFACAYCEHKKVCHLQAPPVKSCRSCYNSQVMENGTWVCKETGVILTEDDQLNACDSYLRL